MRLSASVVRPAALALSAPALLLLGSGSGVAGGVQCFPTSSETKPAKRVESLGFSAGIPQEADLDEKMCHADAREVDIGWKVPPPPGRPPACVRGGLHRISRGVRSLHGWIEDRCCKVVAPGWSCDSVAAGEFTRGKFKGRLLVCKDVSEDGFFHRFSAFALYSGEDTYTYSIDLFVDDDAERTDVVGLLQRFVDSTDKDWKGAPPGAVKKKLRLIGN